MEFRAEALEISPGQGTVLSGFGSYLQITLRHCIIYLVYSEMLSSKHCLRLKMEKPIHT